MEAAYKHVIIFHLKDVYIESMNFRVDSSTQQPYRVAKTVRSKQRNQLIYESRQETQRSRQVAETVRGRQTKQPAYIKTRHQTFRKAQRQTDRQQKLINVDREADT